MKKILSLILVLVLSITLTSCKDTITEKPYENFLEIYYLNDLHGALTPDDTQLGISYIANLINTKKEASPENVLFLVGGDMLQGSALSNYYLGASTIELLNLSNLDAFTIGNHEFDWGLDSVARFKDANEENGEADFPFLGANIFYKGTTDIPEFIDPYTIIQKGVHKIGIIGTIGYGIESAIAQNRIDDYEFGSPLDSIKEYSYYLRTEENCDMIIVVSHDSGNSLNGQVTALEGDYKVDAVFNGHSHSAYARLTNGTPAVQSGSNGENIGYVRWDFLDTGTTVKYDTLDYFSDPLLSSPDPDVEAQLQTYILDTYDLLNTEIIVSDDYYSSGSLSSWLAELVREATNADIGLQNGGGTRNNIDNNHSITLSTLYQIWPFDNVIKTVMLPGSVVKGLVGDYYSSTDISYFENDTLYKVAVNDYSFDKTGSAFQNGTEINNTGIVLRDLVQAELELQSSLYSYFSTNNSILTTYATYQTEEETTNP